MLCFFWFSFVFNLQLMHCWFLSVQEKYFEVYIFIYKVINSIYFVIMIWVGEGGLHYKSLL